MSYRRLVIMFVSTALVAVVLVAALIVRDSDISLERRIDTLSRVTAGAAQFMLFVFIIGSTSMVVIHTLKRTAFLRGRFHHRQLVRILNAGDSDRLHFAVLRIFENVSRSEAYVRLDIPVDQLVAQLGAWVDLDLDRSAVNRGDELDPGITMSRITAEQQLDVVQVSIRNAWHRFLYVAASTIALVIAAATLLIFPVNAGVAIGLLVASFAFGGFFAGFTRDIVALVERGRSAS